MKHHYMAWLVSITLTSRLVFKHVFHLEFDSSHLWIGWQVIDPQLLQHHLLQASGTCIASRPCTIFSWALPLNCSL
ncbi:hypothetical protein [Chitinophaga sp. GbtcB8]|uniref:hypothetical protein n=1 Tax=Chitinophaga sp. GbtcB8 TaxID=2824753 RepID=UPI001C30D994|nr:hypothetical protein [Chitinophaga sp. GbtcB8]